MTTRHGRTGVLIVLAWCVLSIATSWRALHGIDHAARSREALSRAAAARGTAPVPAWPDGMDAREVARLQSEERPLVLDNPNGEEVVTAPVMDADNWNIIGAIGLASRWRERAVAVAAPAVIALLMMLVLLGVPAIRRTPPALRLSGAAALLGAAATLTSVQLSAAVRALASAASAARRHSRSSRWPSSCSPSRPSGACRPWSGMRVI